MGNQSANPGAGMLTSAKAGIARGVAGSKRASTLGREPRRWGLVLAVLALAVFWVLLAVSILETTSPPL